MENFNAVTNAHYSPANQDHLDAHKEAYELSSNAWAGFHQWKEKGRKVKRGAKGCKIFMVCDKKTGEMVNGEEVKKQVVKALYVFNFDHTEEV